MAAIAESWKREPFIAGLPVPYAARFSVAEYAKLREGLIPRVMEDKWFVYFDEPNLFLHRSWTGKPVYRVTFSSNGEGAVVSEALCVSDVLANGGPLYNAKLLDFIVSNLLLGQAKPFPMPEGVKEPTEGVLQHHMSGTGFAQASVKPRPWWMFWRGTKGG